MGPPPIQNPVAFREALAVWVKIGFLGFGGPAGQIALMHKIMVEEKRWIDDARFLHALNYCILLPGPEAQQLAIYIGWLLHGVRGGLAAGVLFVLPGAATVLALALAYARFSELALVQGLFLGIKAGVLALVIEAFAKIAGRVLKDRLSRLIAGGAFVALFAFSVPFPVIVLSAAVIGAVRARSPGREDGATPPIERGPAPHWSASARILSIGLAAWLGPVVLLRAGLGTDHILSALALFFSQVATVAFGGAYAILSYVAQHAVVTQGWLSPDQMLDGLGLAETTPGPLILVLEFVGFLAAFTAPGSLDPYVMGTLGALVVLWATFAPCFVWIFLGAPYVERLRSHARLAAILGAVTSAVAGVILNLSLWFAVHTLFRETMEVTSFGLRLTLPVVTAPAPVAMAIAAASCVSLFALRWGTLATLGAAAALGVAAAMVA